ncbi:MAG TPA: Rrf2 family transcriptional regulator [Amaricoccus sp.]|nr:Rrf2 family transcriptional regulator [Amaricoccus sp.]
MISLKAQYALRALLALAKTDPDELSLIAEIAEAQRIPKKFLEQILLDLKHHGIVASRRGRLGGYSLLRPADQITFGEVLRVIDGPLAPLPCLSRMAYRRCEGCVDERTCEIRAVMARVAEATRSILDSVTIADAMARPERVALAVS